MDNSEMHKLQRQAVFQMVDRLRTYLKKCDHMIKKGPAWQKQMFYGRKYGAIEFFEVVTAMKYGDALSELMAYEAQERINKELLERSAAPPEGNETKAENKKENV